MTSRRWVNIFRKLFWETNWRRSWYVPSKRRSMDTDSNPTIQGHFSEYLDPRICDLISYWSKFFRNNQTRAETNFLNAGRSRYCIQLDGTNVILVFQFSIRNFLIYPFQHELTHFEGFIYRNRAMEISIASHTTHKGIIENIGYLKIVGHKWKVPFSQYKFRILLCIKDLRGTGDTSRSLLKVSQTKQMSKWMQKVQYTILQHFIQFSGFETFSARND